MLSIKDVSKFKKSTLSLSWGHVECDKWVCQSKINYKMANSVGPEEKVHTSRLIRIYTDSKGICFGLQG